MLITRDDPSSADVRVLLAEHLADMRATSPPGSVHALDHVALADPAVTFWTVRDRPGDVVLGAVALKQFAFARLAARCPTTGGTRRAGATTDRSSRHHHLAGSDRSRQECHGPVRSRACPAGCTADRTSAA